ncbi:MAG TPA: HAMP domain-containing sensor histidine kinase [Chondromyces sp.]|nr:HAMP domain-containing sensor histidine kinase [Chondromyces sp.]
MRRQGPITLRHLIVAVLVVVVINAQLTWWIVFILRLSRNHLDSERQRLLGSAQIEAARVHTELLTARTALEAAVLMGDQPGRAAAPQPFVGWRTQPLAQECPAASLNSSGTVELGIANGLSCVSGVAGGEWLQRVLAVGEDTELVAGVDGSIPGVALAPPFDSLSVRPRAEVWQGLLDEYRRRIVMMVSEGGFFAVLLLVLVGLLWQTFRREMELERQHHNFLSAVTHELKSPLAAMRLALETVLGGRASGADARRFLGNALEDAERLEGLVQKVLESTRFAGGRSVTLRKDAPLSRVVTDAAAAFSRRAMAAGAELEVSVEPDIYGDVDEEAMAIAISNLLENAIKYGGRPPRIELRFGLEGRRAVLEVADNGNGVVAGDRERIFDRFFRSGDELTRSSDGTGLGLFLVQRIVVAHRGKVEVASTGPEGSVFRIELPGYER